MTAPAVRIGPARSAADVAVVQALFQAYASALPVSLDYQDFAAELAGLPGRYAPPSGALLLAQRGPGAALGCVALRALEAPGCCEMKRLYVAPAARGSGLGASLVAAAIAAAEGLGYAEMRLDTLPSMSGALRLYEAAGFVPIAPYYASPVAGTRFLARSLA